jgi:hypothetical protein
MAGREASQLGAHVVVVRGAGRRANLAALLRLLRALQLVRTAPARAAAAAAAGDYAQALEVLRPLPEVRQLQLLLCAREPLAALKQSAASLERTLLAEFVRAAAGERWREEKKAKGRKGARWTAEDLRGHLGRVTRALLQTERLQAGLQAYRERMAKLLPALADAALRPRQDPGAAAAAAPAGTPTAARAAEPLAPAEAVREFSAEAFLRYLALLFRKFLRRLELARDVQAVLAEILKASGGADEAPGHYLAQMRNDAAYSLRAAAELAHAHVANLFQYRADAHRKLVLPDFAAFYNATQRYLAAAETLAGVGGGPLKTSLATQSRAYLEEYHVRRLNILSVVLENEPWAAADVPGEFQAIVDRLQRAPPGPGGHTAKHLLAVPSEVGAAGNVSMRLTHSLRATGGRGRRTWWSAPRCTC